MTDKVQKIKQEIERQIEEGKVKCQQSKENNDHESFVAWSEHVATCGKILVFINSLPEEPESKDLEEAAEAFYNNCNLAKSSWWDEGILHKMSESKETFIAGAEWQKEKHNKQFGFLNLKDCKDAYNRWKSTQDNPSAALAWVRACEWQKQQMKEVLQTEYEKGRFDMREEMMKDAIEGWCISDGSLLNDIRTVETEKANLKVGDKVKIIIIKDYKRIDGLE